MWSVVPISKQRKSPQLQIIKVVQIKTTMRSNFSPIKLAIHFLNEKANKYWEADNTPISGSCCKLESSLVE